MSNLSQAVYSHIIIVLAGFMSVCGLQQHKQNRTMERDHFNKSNIDFTKFLEAPNDPQQSKIYTYSTDIAINLKEQAEFTQIETRHYRNKIFHSAHKYRVPVYDYPRPTQTNTSYHEFYSTHRKFVKPYGENTKHADTLNKNKSILRRCHFDLPIPAEPPQPRQKDNSSTFMRTRRTASRYQKKQALGSTTAVARREGFDRTVNNQYLVFRRLFEKERSGRGQRIELDNSMNRLLAAEMINLQISRTGGKSRSKTIEA